MAKELKEVKGEKVGVAKPDSGPKRELPRITFTAKDLPEIKSWKVGGKYHLELEVEQVSMSKNEYGFEEEKDELKSTFKVMKVKALHNPGNSDHDDDGEKKGIEYSEYKNPNRIG